MICDCPNFCHDLLNLSTELLAKGNERSRWTVFEEFLIKYMPKKAHSLPLRMNPYFCSFKICSFLANKREEFRHHDTLLLTFLVDLLNVCYSKHCASVFLNLDYERITAFSSERVTLGVVVALRGTSRLRANPHPDFMKLLLNFNFLATLSGSSPFFIEELNSEFGSFMVSLNDEQGNRHFIPDCLEAVMLFKRKFNQEEDGYKNKRLFLIIKALTVVFLKLKGEKDIAGNILQCLHMYFTGTTDSLLSVFEVRCVLYCCLHVLKKYELFETYCRNIEDVFPEFPTRITPRSLTHLSRCQVRLSLVGHLPLPSAIEKLHLPKNLKDFVLGDVRDLTRERKSLDSLPITFSEIELLFHQFIQ